MTLLGDRVGAIEEAGRLLRIFLGGGNVVAVEVTVPHPMLSLAVEPEEVCDCGSSRTEFGENSSSISTLLPVFWLSGGGEQLKKSAKVKLLHRGNSVAKSRP